jgi:hypothetical protein
MRPGTVSIAAVEIDVVKPRCHQAMGLGAAWHLGAEKDTPSIPYGSRQE